MIRPQRKSGDFRYDARRVAEVARLPVPRCGIELGGIVPVIMAGYARCEIQDYLNRLAGPRSAALKKCACWDL